MYWKRKNNNIRVKKLADLIFGTSGWDYQEWANPFYENEKKKFTFYTNYFKTAEINSTFYKYPTKGMVYG